MGCVSDAFDCDDDEKPAHRVKISNGFEIGKYEVTQAQWMSVMGSNPSHFRGPEHPVENVQLVCSSGIRWQIESCSRPLRL